MPIHRILAACLFLLGCSSENRQYCDEDTPCASAERPYCDLTGALGAKNGCVRAPPDGGRPTPIDAAPDSPCFGVDCSDLTDECSVGVCDPETGECHAEPSREGESCGDEQTCGEWGECEMFSDSCDESGKRYKSCHDFTCEAGQCVKGAAYDEEEACTRDTDGDSCGVGTSVSSCGECGYSSDCDETGSKACSCKDYECSAGSCVAGSSYSCNRSCGTRNTDGQTCATFGCPGGGFRAVCCSNGACNDECIDCGSL